MLRNKSGSPVGQGIQGFAAEQEITDQGPKDRCGGQIRFATGGMSQVTVEEPGQTQPIEEVANEGSSVHLEDFQTRGIGQSRQRERGHGNLLAKRGERSLATLAKELRMSEVYKKYWGGPMTPCPARPNIFYPASPPLTTGRTNSTLVRQANSDIDSVGSSIAANCG